MSSGGIVRTLRIRLRRKLGNLGLLTSAIGDAGASVGEIATLQIGHSYTVRDFHMVLDDDAHLSAVLNAVGGLNDCELVEVFPSSLQAHRGGKIETRARVSLDDMKAFNAAVSPGVSEIVSLIDDDPSYARAYTSIARTIAIVSDGSGFRGVGRVRAQAILPVLEAKAALLAKTANISSYPLALNINGEDEFVQTVEALAPSCGGILIDAVEGARATLLIKRLGESLKLPIFHDDADAPAVCGLAALISACRRSGRDLNKVTVGQIGLGTAGGAVAQLVMSHTKNPVLGEDVHPGAIARHVALGGKAASLDEIMKECDVVIANTGHGDVIPASMVRSGQAIIALSEPRPEITPYDAMLAGAAFAADGKAINKSVVLPGMFLGALSVNATAINDEMKIAAAIALADTALEGDLMASPLDVNAHVVVATAVAKAAVSSGVSAAGAKVPDEKHFMSSLTKG